MFKDNFFDLNHTETLSSATFILAKIVLMFLWEINKFVSSAIITIVKGFDALNKSFI